MMRIHGDAPPPGKKEESIKRAAAREVWGTMRRAMSRYARPLSALLSLVLSLALAELFLARFHPMPDPFARFKSEDRASSYVPSAHPPHDTLTVIAEEGLPGVRGKVVFVTNNVGFRGGELARPKPKGELRVILYGGSTAECMLLDDAQALHGVLERELAARGAGRRARVYNAAKSGDKSYDHVALLSQRLVHLEPDLVVLLAGVNDLRAAVYGADYLHLGSSRAAPYSLTMLAKFAATEFQIPRGLYALLHPESERERLERMSMVTDYRAKVALGAGRPVSDLEPRTDLASYERNLRTIAGTAAAHGTGLVLATQGTTWNSPDPEAPRWHWLTYLDGVRYREDKLDGALERYNDVMRRLGEAGAAGVCDLARALPKSRELFYDDAHFTAAGAAKAGALLAECMAAGGLLAPRGSAGSVAEVGRR